MNLKNRIDLHKVKLNVKYSKTKGASLAFAKLKQLLQVTSHMFAKREFIFLYVPVFYTISMDFLRNCPAANEKTID